MNRYMQGKRKGKVAFVFIAIIVGIGLLIALLQFLWNTLITDIFQLREITYWEALGLFILSKLLFAGGPKRSSGFREKFKRSMDKDSVFSCEDQMRIREEWRRRFKDKFEQCNSKDSE